MPPKAKQEAKYVIRVYRNTAKVGSMKPSSITREEMERGGGDGERRKKRWREEEEEMERWGR